MSDNAYTDDAKQELGEILNELVVGKLEKAITENTAELKHEIRKTTKKIDGLDDNICTIISTSKKTEKSLSNVCEGINTIKKSIDECREGAEEQKNSIKNGLEVVNKELSEKGDVLIGRLNIAIAISIIAIIISFSSIFILMLR